MSTEIRVPTLGESVTEATVATWFKKPGDSVAVDGEGFGDGEADAVGARAQSQGAVRPSRVCRPARPGRESPFP